MNKEQLQEKLGQETKYSKYYLLIIEKAKSENRKKLKKDNKNYIYYENHHILPSSIYKEYKILKDNPWNGVLLTAKEHYICHTLIWKHYKIIGHTYNCIKMGYALQYMNKINTRSYKLKIKNFHSQETKDKIGKANSKALKGKKLPQETKDKIGKAIKGKKKPVRTKEHSLKLGLANKGKKDTPETRARKSKAFKGRILSQETKNKISEAHKGKTGIKHSEETIKKIITTRRQNKIFKTIYIYDNYNNIIHICDTKFDTFCKNNNLPYTYLYKCYRENTKINYKDSGNIKRAKELNYYKFQGWYARENINEDVL